MPYLAGLGPNQTPTAADLGAGALLPLEGQVFTPQAGATPHMPGQAVIRRDSDTGLTVVYKGFDGVLRGFALAPMVPL